MKYLKHLFLLFAVYGCEKSNDKHIAIDTWNRCSEDGVYWEYKITDKYMLVMTSELDDVWIFKNQILDTLMIWSEYKNGKKLMTNNDTIFTLSKSEKNIVLRGKNSGTTWDLNKIEININPIDSTNLSSWKKNTLMEFYKRALAHKCPAKPLPTINMDSPIEYEEIIIEEETR